MVFDTSFEKLESFIKSLGMTREKIMDYWMKQLCWLSNDEKCENLKLQEIIQKEEERRKKSAKIVLKPNF